jgi:uncharacterized protein YceK
VADVVTTYVQAAVLGMNGCNSISKHSLTSSIRNWQLYSQLRLTQCKGSRGDLQLQEAWQLVQGALSILELPFHEDLLALGMATPRLP